MPENNENLVTLKIRKADREWVKDEQVRLRKAEGDEPGHAEIFGRMVAAYESQVAQNAHAKGGASPNSGEAPIAKTNAIQGSIAKPPEPSALLTLAKRPGTEEPRNPLEAELQGLLFKILRGSNAVHRSAITLNIRGWAEVAISEDTQTHVESPIGDQISEAFDYLISTAQKAGPNERGYREFLAHLRKLRDQIPKLPGGASQHGKPRRKRGGGNSD